MPDNGELGNVYARGLAEKTKRVNPFRRMSNPEDVETRVDRFEGKFAALDAILLKLTQV